MNDGPELSEEAIELIREHADACRDLAESDLPIVPYADAALDLIEEHEND